MFYPKTQTKKPNPKKTTVVYLTSSNNQKTTIVKYDMTTQCTSNIESRIASCSKAQVRMTPVHNKKASIIVGLVYI